MHRTAQGLTTSEAAARLTRDGPNVLPQPKRHSLVRRLVGELIHFFALMLWVAGGLAFLARLPQLGVAIFAVILINALFALAQEARADRAASRLRSMLPTRVTVRRDGRRQIIEAADVVVDDVPLLESGDRVPADAVLMTGNRLDTSMLTGESVATSVADGGQLYAGTFLVEGEARAVVAATGDDTRLRRHRPAHDGHHEAGHPAHARPGAGRSCHRRHRGRRGGLFFAISLLVGSPLEDGFVFAIGVTVALVPEALLPTVTLSLAWGAEQMARRQILVRNLEAVETLGSTTFICTHKTGTLTRNQMAVVEAWTPAGTMALEGVGYEPKAAISVVLGHAGPPPAGWAVALLALRSSSPSTPWTSGSAPDVGRPAQRHTADRALGGTCWDMVAVRPRSGRDRARAAGLS